MKGANTFADVQQTKCVNEPTNERSQPIDIYGRDS